MQENSNRSPKNSSLNLSSILVSSTFGTEPITAQPQQFTRSYVQSTNSSINMRESSDKSTHLVPPAARNIRPWMNLPQSPGENTRMNSSDSVVINFDHLNEPLPSSSVSLYDFYSGATAPTKLHPTSSSVESNAQTDRGLPNNNRLNEGILNNSNSNNSDQNGNGINSTSNTSINVENEGPPSNNNNNTNVDASLSQLDKFINKYIPFLTFLAVKAAYDHRQGILIFAALLVTFMHANSVVKREIAKQSRRSFLSLGIIFINLFVSICFIYFVFQDQKLYKVLVFYPPYAPLLNIWDVFWLVGISDFVLKFITIQLKVGMTLFPPTLLPYSARGKWYLLVERASQLYRGLVPVQPWLYYFWEVYKGPEDIAGMVFSVAYVVSKGSDILTKFKLFCKAFLKLLYSSSLGVRPSSEQLVSAGSQCPICHDEYNSPILLQCRHVFCEGCVSTWFDREQTCPLCRAKIADDPSWRDGSTSLYTQLF